MFLEKFKFLLQVLPELKANKEVNSMLSVTLSEEDETCPELFQVIDNYDGKFTVQHLAGVSHETISTKIVDRDELPSLINEVETGLSMELLWGPFQLIEHKF